MLNYYSKTNHHKKKKPYASHPLHCWDISNSIMNYGVNLIDVEVLKRFRDKFDWSIEIAKELNMEYEALVLTGLDRKIIWANAGFERMTGYTRGFAEGKKPVFLQGPNTSDAIKTRIRAKLAEGIRFAQTITNYRKDGAEYQCHVSIVPLYNSQNVLTHFLALEKKAS